MKISFNPIITYQKHLLYQEFFTGFRIYKLTIKKVYVATFLFTSILCCPNASAQVSNKLNVLGYDQYRNQAQLYFSKGDYNRANNLYKACINLPGIPPELQTEILAQIKRGVDIERLKQEADRKLRQGDKEGAKVAYDKILSPRFNPSDRSVHDKREKLNEPKLHLSDIEKWEKQADELLSQTPPNYQRANEVLRVIPIRERSAVIEAKLKLTRDLPYRIAIINKKSSVGLSIRKEIDELESIYPDLPLVDALIKRVNDEKEYWQKRRIAEQYTAACRFEQAKIIYKTLRQNYPQFNKLTTARISKLQRTTQLISEVNELLPDTDPNKQAKILYNYALLYQVSRSCIEEDYFDYVYTKGVTQMQNNKLPEAIINFERAFSVSKFLANRNRVPALADSCRRLLVCQRQSQVYRSMLADAESLYRRCLSDSAINLYKKAQIYNCQKTDSKVEETWQNRSSGVIQNRGKQSNFMRLVNTANVLLEENRCEEALLLYRQADSTQVDCQQLDKSILRIVECENCIKQQCFDTLMAKADRSREANYRRDQLRYYRAALECPAPLSRVADLQKVIKELECIVENKNCPPLPPIPLAKSFIKPSIMIGVNRTTPDLYKQGKPEVFSAATSYIIGTRLERISFVKPFDFRADLRYANYSFNNLNEEGLIRQSFRISTVEGSIGMKLHPIPRNQGRVRPYIFGSAGYNMPIAYKSEDYAFAKKFTSTEDLSTGFVVGRAGIGFEIQKPKWGLSLEVYYGLSKKDLFHGEPKQSFQNESNYSAPKATLLGIDLGLRLW